MFDSFNLNYQRRKTTMLKNKTLSQELCSLTQRYSNGDESAFTLIYKCSKPYLKWVIKKAVPDIPNCKRIRILSRAYGKIYIGMSSFHAYENTMQWMEEITLETAAKSAAAFRRWHKKLLINPVEYPENSKIA